MVRDQLPPAIEETRRYQTLQALVNCTRRSLLPDPNVTEDQRREWEALIPTPIRQVLSTIRKHQVQALLMGGQACVFYGAAQV